MALSSAQQRVLDLLDEQGGAVLAMATNEALGTVASNTARSLQDLGLVHIWSRSNHQAEAVLPGSVRDVDLDGIGD